MHAHPVHGNDAESSSVAPAGETARAGLGRAVSLADLESLLEVRDENLVRILMKQQQERARKRAEDKQERARERADDKQERARERADDKQERARERADDKQERARERAEDKEYLNHRFNEMPHKIMEVSHQLAQCVSNASDSALALGSGKTPKAFGCSGSRLGSTGSNLIITAAHCVHATREQQHLSHVAPAHSVLSGVQEGLSWQRSTIRLVYGTTVDVAILIHANVSNDGQTALYDLSGAADELQGMADLLKTHRGASGALVGTPVHVSGSFFRVQRVQYDPMGALTGPTCLSNAAGGFAASAETAVARVALTDDAAAASRADGVRLVTSSDKCTMKGEMQPVMQAAHKGNSGTVVFRAFMHRGQCVHKPHSLVSGHYVSSGAGLMSVLPDTFVDVLEWIAAALRGVSDAHGPAVPGDRVPLFRMECLLNNEQCHVHLETPEA